MLEIQIGIKIVIAIQREYLYKDEFNNDLENDVDV